MKINIGHLIKYAFFLAHILICCFIYYYSQTSTNTLPTSEPLQSLPPNEGVSVGSATVVGPFVPPTPNQEPDINELIILFYGGFLSFISVAMMLKKIRQGYSIPIQKNLKKLRLVHRILSTAQKHK